MTPLRHRATWGHLHGKRHHRGRGDEREDHVTKHKVRVHVWVCGGGLIYVFRSTCRCVCSHTYRGRCQVSSTVDAHFISSDRVSPEPSAHWLDGTRLAGEGWTWSKYTEWNSQKKLIKRSGKSPSGPHACVARQVFDIWGSLPVPPLETFIEQKKTNKAIKCILLPPSWGWNPKP